MLCFHAVFLIVICFWCFCVFETAARNLLPLTDESLDPSQLLYINFHTFCPPQFGPSQNRWALYVRGGLFAFLMDRRALLIVRRLLSRGCTLFKLTGPIWNPIISLVRVPLFTCGPNHTYRTETWVRAIHWIPQCCACHCLTNVSCWKLQSYSRIASGLQRLRGSTVARKRRNNQRSCFTRSPCHVQTRNIFAAW